MIVTRKNISRSVAALIAPIIVLFVVALSGTTANAQASRHSEQVIFSGVGFAGEGDWASPVGFWIWCEADSANPYQGQCNGAMYVYFQLITTGVSGTVTEGPAGIYTMHVTSNKGASVLEAFLVNDDAPVKGPRNGVNFMVTTQAGTSSGSTATAVVNVTGP